MACALSCHELFETKRFVFVITEYPVDFRLYRQLKKLKKVIEANIFVYCRIVNDNKFFARKLQI